MKKYLFLLFAIVSVISMTSCRSGYVNMTNEDQEFKINTVGGDVEPERYVDIKNKEAHGSSLQQMYEEQRLAVAQGDMDKAKSLQELIDNSVYSQSGAGYGAATYQGNGYPGPSYYGSGTGGVAQPGRIVMVKVENRSNFAITLKNGPFAGLYLSPGKTSERSYPVAIGTITVKYKMSDGKDVWDNREFPVDIDQDKKSIWFNP